MRHALHLLMRPLRGPVLLGVGLAGLLTAASAFSTPPGGKPGQGMPHGLPAGTDCTRCHGKENFSAIHAEQVHQDGSFPLVGEHGKLKCVKCHDPKLGFGNLSAECVSCHSVRDAHLRLVGDDCATCHDPRGWIPNRFRHSQTGFPLSTAHRFVNCDQCHAIGYPVVPTDCQYCH